MPVPAEKPVEVEITQGDWEAVAMGLTAFTGHYSDFEFIERMVSTGYILLVQVENPKTEREDTT